DPSNTYIPLRFTYDAGATAEGACTITSYEPGYTQAILTMVQADSPSCGVSPGEMLGSSSLMPYMTTGAQTATARRLMDFGPICVDYEKSVKLTLKVGARATCGTTANLLRYKTVAISPIQYRNSCFAQGTRVVRASGEPDAIENFKVGDKLLANDEGLVLTVTGVSRGVERSAMVRLEDDQGHEALITQTHPVVTANRGIVRAEDLKVNDRLVTREGTSVLTRLTRELYKGTVYNLAVGTPEELARLSPESRTLYAGGLLMGDYHMKAELDARRARPSAPQASIPASWMVDYVNTQPRSPQELAR
ncbi:MAG TPA: Hint domain-containing protein, partial [Archangium sp.]|nr:Hint domain-containing protein [Archangium sp.]